MNRGVTGGVNDSTTPALSTHCLRLALFIAALAFPCAASAQHWSRFRGPDGNGVSTQPAPTSFTIGWKVEVPAEGMGSPVVWGDRVFLSGGDATTRSVMCFDLATGKQLWQSQVPSTDTFDVPDQSGIAASTVATDGQRVYAIFANGYLAAFDFAGKLAWSKNLGAPKNTYGHTSSLLTWKNRLIVQLDQGDADEKLSKLTALDGATGKVAWEKPRDVGASWATPISFESAGQTQLLTLAPPFAISYAISDGSELWRAECLDGEVTPSPVFANGTAFIVSPSSKLQAFRVDGHGDVTKSHLDWIAEDGIPDITSPVTNGELAFVCDTSGTLSCYDAKTGKKQWEHDMEIECKASPSIVGGKVILIATSGVIIEVEAAREFKELARSEPLGEQVVASPAFAGNKMLVRGAKYLFAIP